VAARTLLALKSGLNDPERPIGVLLLVGPTGVGKTELARAIARFLFSSGSAMERFIRLDMSEYQGPGAAERLFSQPNGEPGILLQRVRTTPFSLILLDEIEKASPEVFDALLTLFDEGRFTDRFGRLTWFRSSLLLMTSNLGTSTRDPVGFSGRGKAGEERAVREFFRPEFFNRIDAVVPFHPLEPATVAEIVRMDLAQLETREGIQRLGLKLTFTPALIEALATRGYDPRLGARPLQRLLEQRVVATLSRYLLEASPSPGSTLRLDWVGDEVEIGVG
jgi:ATP-dependent Clp protease ATP-binding subunit ClpC